MKKILSTILTLAACTTLTAQDFKITHGPWLCDLTSDGVTVVWATSKPALSWVEVAEDDGRSFYAAEHERRYETVAGRKQARKTLHSIRLKGLPARHEIPLPHLLAGGARVEIQRQGLLRRHRGIERLLAPAVRVQHPSPRRDATSRSSFWNDIHGRADYMAGLCRPIDFAQIDFVALQRRHVEQQLKVPNSSTRDFIDASVGAFASETPILYNRGNHETRGIYADHLPEYFPKVGGNYYKLYMAGSVAVLLLDCGEDKPDSDIEYGGLGLRRLPRGGGRLAARNGRLGRVPQRFGPHRAAHPARERHLARQHPSRRAVSADPERCGHRRDAVGTRTAIRSILPTTRYVFRCW